MSRKTIFTVAAVLGAAVGTLATLFELSVNGGVLAVGITGALVYIFGEAKADLAKIGAQAARFKDPKFWLAFISGVVTLLGVSGTIAPAVADSLIAFLTLIIGVLFKSDPRLAKT